MGVRTFPPLIKTQYTFSRGTEESQGKREILGISMQDTRENIPDYRK